jgi:YHS domain-containing protein
MLGVTVLRFVVIAFIIYIAVRLIKGLTVSGKHSSQPGPLPSIKEDLVEDPQCRTYIPQSSAYKKVVSGRTLYFCGKKCFDTYTSQKNDQE